MEKLIDMLAHKIVISFHMHKAAQQPIKSIIKAVGNQVTNTTRSYSTGSSNINEPSNFQMIRQIVDAWPINKFNTILNICPQGHCMIIERLGKFHRIEQSGMFFVIPFIEKISFVVDMREKALSISPQSCITKDNVQVHVSGNLYCQFLNASQAAYGSNNPLYAVRQHAQSSMRAAIGELELDEILHARAKLNSIIRSSITESASSWGIEIKRYEITEVSPDRHITEAMDKQAAAERDRRKKVLDAEGQKKSLELESEGLKISLINQSEGNRIRLQNEAEGRKIQTLLEAEAEAEATLIKAQAQAESLKIIAKVLSESNMDEAIKLELAKSVSFLFNYYFILSLFLLLNSYY